MCNIWSIGIVLIYRGHSINIPSLVNVKTFGLLKILGKFTEDFKE